jgi:ribosome biogenesis protein Nip4
MNAEIRTNYGHTVANFFRGAFEPDYITIVRGAAKKLGVSFKDFHTVEEVEQKIIVEVMERTKQHTSALTRSDPVVLAGSDRGQERCEWRGGDVMQAVCATARSMVRRA